MRRACAAALAFALAVALPIARADEGPGAEPAAADDPRDADLQELVRRGGRFPPGYVPRAGAADEAGPARAYLAPLGRLILLTLDAPPGSVESQVYGEALRDVGVALARIDEAPWEVAWLALRIARRSWVGSRDPDPARARAHGEVLALALPPEPAPAPTAPAGPSLLLGGARLTPGTSRAGATAAQAVEVSPDGPAAAAGVRVGDRVCRISGKPVDPAALAAAEARLAAGESVPLSLEGPDGGTREVVLEPVAR